MSLPKEQEDKVLKIMKESCDVTKVYRIAPMHLACMMSTINDKLTEKLDVIEKKVDKLCK